MREINPIREERKDSDRQRGGRGRRGHAKEKKGRREGGT